MDYWNLPWLCLERLLVGHLLTRTCSRWRRRTPFTSPRTSRSSIGNKRTGLLAAVVFLDLNGVAIRDPEGRLYDAMIAIAERRMDKLGLAALLRELSGTSSSA